MSGLRGSSSSGALELLQPSIFSKTLTYMQGGAFTLPEEARALVWMGGSCISQE